MFARVLSNLLGSVHIWRGFMFIMLISQDSNLGRHGREARQSGGLSSRPWSKPAWVRPARGCSASREAKQRESCYPHNMVPLGTIPFCNKIGTFDLISLLKVPIGTFSNIIDLKVRILLWFSCWKGGVSYLWLSYRPKGTMILRKSSYLLRLFKAKSTTPYFCLFFGSKGTKDSHKKWYFSLVFKAKSTITPAAPSTPG